MATILTPSGDDTVILTGLPVLDKLTREIIRVTDDNGDIVDLVVSYPYYLWVSVMGPSYWTMIEGSWSGSVYSNTDTDTNNTQSVELETTGGWEITDPTYQPLKIKISWYDDSYTLYGPTLITVKYSDASTQNFVPSGATTAAEEFTLVWPSPIATITGITITGSPGVNNSDDDWNVNDILFLSPSTFTLP